MAVVSIIFQIGGSLGLFLYGMKVLGDGIQQSAGDRLQRTLGFMTGSRTSAVFTGLAVTAVIQSSSATTVMLVSFVNAGILTLQQAIGVIMGANIGTTVTIWIVSLVGFSLKISKMALPAIGIGFLMRHIKWKHQESGNIVLGFGLLFMGLDFLTKSMPHISAENLYFMRNLQGNSVILVSALIGLVLTVLVHSSSASTAIVLTMSFYSIVDYRQASAMILGANIGTTIDAVLAAIGTRTTARRTALVHVLFNVIGVAWALLLFNPFVRLVAFITPDVSITPDGSLTGDITNYLAMFHTTFNVLNTILFFPFVRQFAKLVSVLIKDTDVEEESGKYHFSIKITGIREAPEFYIVRVEKEIRDMAGIVFAMYGEVRGSLTIKELEAANGMVQRLSQKTDYVSAMREELTGFLMHLSRRHIHKRALTDISLLLRIISDLKDMATDCYSMGNIVQTSVRKNRTFEKAEVDALLPYMGQVHEFLAFVNDNLGGKLTEEQSGFAYKLEDAIDISRNALRKLGRKRIEEGGNVKTELLFIDLVRRIEKLGDYCYSISKSLSRMKSARIQKAN
ncbi:MAG: Na/Pi cotransporter family protein [Spirochaetaceae bacterium]|jgi:phosphate:Na+ symporter|nr:Na/Pi cotransporter family protein [Spirochaetaceae bacterium]